MFKSRQASAPVSPVNPPSIEWVRKRAKHRLLGVSVLVLAGVVLFPMLFDTQPRPIPVDIPIDIPSRQTAQPLKVEASSATVAGAVVDGAATLPAAQAVSKAEPDDEVIIPKAAAVVASKPATVSVAPSPPAQAKVAEKAADKVAEKSTEKPTEKPSQATDVTAHTPAAATPPKAAMPSPAAVAAAEAARAKALLEGRPVPKVAPVAAEGRFIVQVGAFAETARAQQARQQLERAGLKTYTHVADTADGKRIRVRLGPFATRAEAEKAAVKAKATGLPAAILTL